MAHRPDCRACEGTGTTTLGQKCICNPRDCWHGSLARKCELCERDDEIEDQGKAIERQQQEIARLTRELDEYLGAYTRHERTATALAERLIRAEAERDRLRKAIALIRDSGYIRGWWWEEHVAPLIAEAEGREG